MHEMSIAQGLIDIINEEMDKHGARVLRSVKLHIGQLTAVVPDSLAFCFEVITAETPLAGAKLDMVTIPLTGRCKSCEMEFKIEHYVFECPHCRSGDIETVAGKDLSIVELEVD